MAIHKTALAAAMIVGMASAGSAALAEPSSAETSLTASLEAALKSLDSAAPEEKTKDKLQQVIARILALSDATPVEKQAALEAVAAADAHDESGFPAETRPALTVELAAILGSDVTASGGGAGGSAGFGTAGLGGGGGGGTSVYSHS
jgi:hypothetical protein